ncbi:MAG TPA: penicillin-binding transpeptidase domain-containing protein, partial [Microbacteriaceae bacterium]|nr:penicillin-binding transpeptidase domain-containing protein [Microbacteriaceae bacterium]
MRTTAAIRRRILSIAILAAAIVALFVLRLVNVQVVQANQLTKAATSDRSVTTTINGLRGPIVDSTGTVLARTVLRWNVQISPSVAITDHDLDKHADEIGKVTGLGGGAVLSIIHQALAQDPKSQYAKIVDGIDATKLDTLTAFHIPWLYFKRVQSRIYPDGQVAGNIVGFVGAQGEAQAGMEYAYNSCLAGTNGTQVYQRGADNVPIPGTTRTTKKAKNGGTLVLTLDADLQWFAQQKLAENVKELGGNYGIVTVMNAKTGQLKAVAEYPSVDPNDPGATPAADRGSRAFQAPFEPGSVFKAITASALINEGAATPLTRVLAPYHFTSPGGASLYDAYYHAPWPLTLTGVLVNSSNTGISTLGQRLDDKTRYDYMRKFGVGQAPAIKFPGESAGILNPYQTWGAQTKFATMFGQGVS